MSMTKIGEMNAYVAAPDATAKAAVIVIPEIFGVNEGIRRKCDTWAAQGYLAVAIDLFWRFAPGVELNPDVEAELNEAFGYFQRYNADEGVIDIETTIKAIRHGLDRHAPVARVGCVGYCLGGRLAYMAATRTDIDCAVGYYGVMIDTHTADGVKVAKEHLKPSIPMIVLETALPIKFAATLVEALGKEPDRPPQFEGIEGLPKRVMVLPQSAAAVKEYIASHCN